MIIPWLEGLVKTGSVSRSAADQISHTCLGIVKDAASKSKAGQSFGQTVKKYFRTEGPAGFKAGANVAASTTIGLYGEQAYMDHRSRGEALKNKQAILQLPQFAGDPEKAEARFSEIIGVAPSAAQNMQLMKRLMSTRLHTGLSSEDVDRLSMFQATVTPSGKKQDKMSQKLAGQTVASIVEICKEAGIKQNKRFVKSIVAGAERARDTLLSPKTKKSLGDVATKMGIITAFPLIYGVGQGVVSVVTSKMDATKLKAMHDATFNTIISRAKVEEDSALLVDLNKTREAFNTLVHFSPHMASEPMAAKSFVTQAIAYDKTKQKIVDPTFFKTLTDIESNASRTKVQSPFFKGLSAGTQSLGLSSALTSSVRDMSSILTDGA